MRGDDMTKRRWHLLFVLLACLLTASLVSFLMKKFQLTPFDADTDLISKVSRAFQTGQLNPRNVENIVGITATLNTSKSEDRILFDTTDVWLDPPGQPGVTKISHLRDVVYWIRPVNSTDPKFVAIGWTNEGTQVMFFGIIYSPGGG
jgi:hypothetical protein